MGVNISQYAPFIQGLRSNPDGTPLVVRGELIVREGELPAGTLGRSWVNGLVHHKTVRKGDAQKLRFVAYQIVVPNNLIRVEQFMRLKQLGFEVPWFCSCDTLNDTFLEQTLKERRAASPYAIDGVVVGENDIPFAESAGDDVVNPKDMRAFKMPLGDQQATTRVVDILWAASYQGYWIPRIQIEPVQIGGSRIEFLTGHNARFILDNKITKGATIVVRKSGDVIPTLDHLVSEGTGVIELPKGIWDGPADSASHLKLHDDTAHEHQDVIQKRLEHFASALDIPFLGPGLVTKLITAGITTAGSLARITKPALIAAIGSGMAEKVFPALQKAIENVSEMGLMIASGTMPRGVGEKKLRTLFAKHQDPRQWSAAWSCEGWSQSALTEFLRDGMPAYETWRRREFPSIPYPLVRTVVAAPVVVSGAPVKKEVLCFTGFRSAELEQQLVAKGHEVSDSVSRKTTILVVPNTTAIENPSGKVKKAQEVGTVRLLTREQLIQEYL